MDIDGFCYLVDLTIQIFKSLKYEPIHTIRDRDRVGRRELRRQATDRTKRRLVELYGKDYKDKIKYWNNL